MSEQYKPTEHSGLKQDGTPDKRVGTGGTSLSLSRNFPLQCFKTLKPLLEFAQGKVDPHQAGQQGGQTSGSGSDSSSGSTGSSGGSAKGGKSLFSVFSVDCTDLGAEFAHGKVDPVEAGKKGGNAS
jgi:general stress protein YciG